jgi:pyrroline-5-carboxylate reductase
MSTTNVTIIGGGNLGGALAQGIIKKPSVVKLTVTDRSLEPIKHLEEKGATISTNNPEAIKNADVVLIAVKPFRVLSLLDELKDSFSHRHIVVSLAPGVLLKDIQETLPHCKNIYRAMPNVAASVGESLTCVCSANPEEDENNIVTQIFGELGQALMINEELMDAATVIGACGTAFALRFVRAMVQAGIQIGFDSKTATAIANQTVKGATQILFETKEHPEAAIDRVTTPKGITITGLNEMENQGFSAALIQGILASYRKFEG